MTEHVQPQDRRGEDSAFADLLTVDSAWLVRFVIFLVVSVLQVVVQIGRLLQILWYRISSNDFRLLRMGVNQLVNLVVRIAAAIRDGVIAATARVPDIGKCLLTRLPTLLTSLCIPVPNVPVNAPPNVPDNPPPAPANVPPIVPGNAPPVAPGNAPVNAPPAAAQANAQPAAAPEPIGVNQQVPEVPAVVEVPGGGLPWYAIVVGSEVGVFQGW
jgi:hypothetical protein